jgi:site-specific DNA-methyltransferase (adenine-specific)
MAEPPFKGEQQHTDILSPGQKFCLLQKSALDGAALPRESIDLTITSPPYNLGIDYSLYNDSLSYQDYLTFSETWLRNCYFWSKETGRLCLNVPLDINKGDKHSLGADITHLAQAVGWHYHCTILWNKLNIS